jgi:hypothetical protein
MFEKGPFFFFLFPPSSPYLRPNNENFKLDSEIDIDK